MYEIRNRVERYKILFKDCKALEPVKEFLAGGIPTDSWDYIEKLRVLNTALADAYKISIPVITVWVRDYNYVQETGEIYLTEPNIEEFLHLFRHHLQNVERKYEMRGLTVEGIMELADIPYTDCKHKMYGEDDARAWAKFLIEMAIDTDK